ncbi:hypothetical protein, partial [Okeania sp. SIO2B9]|uniref:hypothetical protein n=1 Tax=Okeania sp. SIO2B9 TaxID=2607782 RepID=UPI00142AB2C0
MIDFIIKYKKEEPFRTRQELTDSIANPVLRSQIKIKRIGANYHADFQINESQNKKLKDRNLTLLSHAIAECVDNCFPELYDNHNESALARMIRWSSLSLGGVCSSRTLGAMEPVSRRCLSSFCTKLLATPNCLARLR